MAASERVAVLDRDGITIEGAGSFSVALPDRLDFTLMFCRDHKVTQLWVHPELAPVFTATGEPVRWYAQALAAGWHLPEKPQPWQYTWQPGTYGRVALVLPALETRAPWREATTGADLLAALLAFRRSVGMAYRSSPGATGTALMRESVSRLELAASVTPQEMPPPARDRATEQDLFWMRPLTEEERGHRYVHAFDKNAMYLAACSGLRLGFGEPLAVDMDRAAEYYAPSRAGYWEVQVEEAEDAAALSVPNPFATGRRDWRDQWMTTASVTLLDEIGHARYLLSGYVYPEAHEALTPWYRRLKAARAELREGNPLAYRALKSVYTQAIGWLDGGWMRESDEPADLFRPDWRHAIISAARANLYRNIVKAYRASGRAPFAVATDCLYYTSDVPRWDDFAHDLQLRMGEAPGEYKSKSSCTLDDVRDCIEIGGTRGLRALQRRLNGTEEAEDATDNRQE